MRTHYTNAVVFTGNADSPLLSDFFVEDGVFAAPDAPMRSCEPLVTVDLRGAFVMPAMLDAHTHASIVADAIRAVPLTPPGVGSVPDMVAALSAFARAHPERTWIEGWGYDESLTAGGLTPLRDDLDRVSRERPVFIRRSDCHSAVVNSKALELAGLTDASVSPEGGAFGRDASGRLDGRLMETPAVRVVEAVMGEVTEEAEVEKRLGLGEHYLSRGILTVTDMMVVRKPLDALALWRKALLRGLPLDVVLYQTWLGGTDPFGMPDLAEDEKAGAARIGGVKLFADGSISARTAFMREPYQLTQAERKAGMTPPSGTLLLTEPVFRAALAYARRNRVQVSIHVMGDASLDRLLDWLEGEDEWMAGVPSVRLEHVTFCHPDQIARLQKMRIRPAMTTQTIFPFAEYLSYRTFLTPELRNASYPVRTLERTTDAFALSSDAPATTWSDPDQPFVSIQAAVTRRDASGELFGSTEAVDVATALSLYTGRAALVLPTEGTIGIIEPGARAHFAVLSGNPFVVPTSRLSQIRVTALYRDGMERWRAQG